MTRRAPLIAAGVLVAVASGGCESTQDRSARLERDAAKVGKVSGLKVTRRSREIRVGATAVLSDANGSAAVVELRNTSRRTLAAVPVAITVRDRKRRLVYANDAPGLDDALVRAPLLEAGKRLLWVNDQVTGAARPSSLRARVGADARRTSGSPPRLQIRGARLERDDTSGVAAVGRVVNRSKVEQRRLVVFGVVRRGRRIVAAGRAVVPRVRPGKAARFNLFFIGNPRGGQLSLAAPPTVIR